MNLIKKLFNKIFINYKYIKSLFDVQNKKLDDINNIVDKNSINIQQLSAEVNNLRNIEQKIDEVALMVNKVQEEFKYVTLNSLLYPISTDKPKVLLAGFYGANNTGDDLMLQAIYQKIDCDLIDISILVARNENINISDMHNSRIIYYPMKRYEFIELAKRFDCLIFGGGALIDDKYFHDPEAFSYDLATILILLSEAFIQNKKIVKCVGLSTAVDIVDDEYISRLKYIISNINEFSVRDAYSQDLIFKLTGCQVLLIPDLAYSLYNDRFELKRNKGKLNSIGIVWICTGENEEKLDYLIKHFSSIYQIHLIPFYNYLNNDIKFFNKYINEKNVFVDNYTNNINELFEIFTNCDFIISMRYHGSLLANMFGLRNIIVTNKNHSHYNNKMQYLSETYDCPIIDICDLDKNILREILSVNNVNKRSLTLKMAKKSAAYIENVVNFDDFVDK